MDSRTVGDNIKKFRQRKDLTQKELAEFLNVTNKAVSRWECGHGLPDIAQLPNIARFFGVSIEELVGEEFPSDSADCKILSSEIPKHRKSAGKTIVVSVSACLLVAALVCIIFLFVSRGRGGKNDVFRFEGEDSLFRGGVRVDYNVDASGGACAAYLYGNAVIFDIESDAAVKNAAVYVRMSSCIDIYDNGEIVGERQIDDISKFSFMRVNNKMVALTGTLLGSGSGNPEHARSWYNWCIVSGRIELAAGKNKIQFIGEQAYNIDYLEIVPDRAKLSWNPIDNDNAPESNI